VVTIGVYGFDESCFFQHLCDAQVDLFVDIRRRRALRGARYAFANSRRLQARLEAMGIRYEHRLDLAPGKITRQIQDIHDRINKSSKRERTCLAPAFIEAYHRECLADFDVEAYLAGLDSSYKTIVFFCVECEPQACHRSLVAEQFAAAGVPVVHLAP
jgi:uncharacterized protein (DUF488 family)